MTLRPADILARRERARGTSVTRRRALRMSALLAAALLLVPLGGLIVSGQRAVVAPSPSQPAIDGTWPVTGRQLVDRLSAEQGYTFRPVPDYGALWTGPAAPTEDDIAYGGPGTIIVYQPLDDPAHALVKADRRSMSVDDSGCLHAWRVLDVLVPDPSDELAVVERLGAIIQDASRSADPLYASVHGSQTVRGGTVHLEYYVIGTDDAGDPIQDPAAFRGYLSFEFIAKGGAAGGWATPEPDSSPRPGPSDHPTKPSGTVLTACGAAPGV